MLIPYKTLLEKYNIQPTGVIHIGAHWGEEAEDYYTNGVKKTIWIEANPECFEKLTQIPFENCSFFNYCLSDKDYEEVTFNVSNNEGQSSSILELEYHKIAHKEVEYINSFQVKTITLDTLIKIDEVDLSEYDFLNADIQGAELLMLKGAKETLNHIKYIYIEVNEKELYKDCALIGEIDEFLSQYNFKRVETEWAGNFGWGDAFYVKY
jgi:FkbM family methyltransferase